MVTNPIRGSRTPFSSRRAMISRIRSAIRAARSAEAISLTLPFSENSRAGARPSERLRPGGGPSSESIGVGAPLLTRKTVRRPAVTTNESGANLLDHFDRLDLVPDLDVVEPPEPDPALEALADLGDVVLEPAQRLDREPVGDHDAVADDPGLRVARDGAAPHEHTGDVAELA